VTSDHNPIDIEHKKVEFDIALYGSIGLESAFGALQTLFTTKKTIQLLTKGKQRFGVISSTIKEGIKADLTLFNPSGEQLFSERHILSKSKNSCFLNAKLMGNVYGCIANNKIVIKNG